jgi:hypothetical protein
VYPPELIEGSVLYDTTRDSLIGAGLDNGSDELKVVAEIRR